MCRSQGPNRTPSLCSKEVFNNGPDDDTIPQVESRRVQLTANGKSLSLFFSPILSKHSPRPVHTVLNRYILLSFSEIREMRPVRFSSNYV